MTTVIKPEIQRHKYTFVHNVFGDFIQNTLDFFSESVYPRFQYKVVGTYDKAVEYLTKKQQYGKEVDQEDSPSIILNPNGDFDLDNDGGGRLQHRFPNLAPGAISRIWDPIYRDQHVLINVGFTRIKGEFELLMILPSFYEWFDVKLLLIQQFGGQGRPIYPNYFNVFFIIPEELANYRYTNPYTGESYILDWNSAGAQDIIAKSTDTNEKVIYGKMRPRYILNGLSDNSNKYGGIDSLADWRLTAQIGYEVEVPTFLVFETDWLLQNLNVELRVGSCYTKYPTYGQPPEDRLKFTSYVDQGINEESHTEPTALPDEAEIINEFDLTFHTRYYHELTQVEIDTTGSIIISLPEIIDNHYLILLNSKYGEIEFSNYYWLDNRSTDIELKENCYSELEVGDLIEVYIYRYTTPRNENISSSISVRSYTRANLTVGSNEYLTSTINIRTSINDPEVITDPVSSTINISSNINAILTRITDLLTSTIELQSNIASRLKVDYELKSNINLLSNLTQPNLIAGNVQNISVNPPGGTYSTPLNISMSTPTIGANIYYTLDGTVPDINSPIYTSPIQLTDTDIWTSKFNQSIWEPFSFDRIYWYNNPPRWVIQDEYLATFNATLMLHNYRPNKFKMKFDKIYGDRIGITMYDGHYNIICNQENYQSEQVIDCTMYGVDISGFEIYSLNEESIITKLSLNILSIMFSDDPPSYFTLQAIALHPTMYPSLYILENYTIN